jgi:hypothetical protein
MVIYLWQTKLVHVVSDRTFDVLSKRTRKDVESIWLTSEDGLLLYDLASAVGCRLGDINDQYIMTLAALAETGREMASKRLQQAAGSSDRASDQAREVTLSMEAAWRRLQTRQQSLAYAVRALAQDFTVRWREVVDDGH